MLDVVSFSCDFHMCTGRRPLLGLAPGKTLLVSGTAALKLLQSGWHNKRMSSSMYLKMAATVKAALLANPALVCAGQWGLTLSYT